MGLPLGVNTGFRVLGFVGFRFRGLLVHVAALRFVFFSEFLDTNPRIKYRARVNFS